MAKLRFKYGAMGSSKSAQALIAKFNYEEGGNKTWFIKPGIDSRENRPVVKSRTGIEAPVQVISKTNNLLKTFSNLDYQADVIIVDEAQFLTLNQVEQLRQIVDQKNTDVLCYGLKNDFQTKLFPGSKRLIELSESISEIKTICACKNKASVNARFKGDKIITKGKQIMIGGNESYRAVCHQCYRKIISKDK